MNMIQRFKQWLRQNRRSSHPVLRISIRIFDAAVSLIRNVKRLLTDGNARAIFYMKLFEQERTHQTTSATCINRYPDIFTGCLTYFGENEKIRILSFGCATGEEVVTLHHYFPQAEIVGAEINKHSLKVCRSIPVGENIHFINSRPDEIQKYAPFDVIFCMAVFQRTPGVIAQNEITDIKKIYPFEKFENQIHELDGYLNRNGLLVIHMSQYDFMDTDIASRYKTYGNYHQNHYGPFVFDRNSKIKKELPYRHSIFIKQE